MQFSCITFRMLLDDVGLRYNVVDSSLTGVTYTHKDIVSRKERRINILNTLASYMCDQLLQEFDNSSFAVLQIYSVLHAEVTDL